MKTILTDERGRLTLGTKLVERYGRKFVIVQTETKIVLHPIPKDPLKDLQELWKDSGIEKYDIKELKRMIRKEAEKEIEERLRKRVR